MKLYRGLFVLSIILFFGGSYSAVAQDVIRAGKTGGESDSLLLADLSALPSRHYDRIAAFDGSVWGSVTNYGFRHVV